MNPTVKRYLISSVTTFLATFLGVLALSLKAGVPLDLTIAGSVGILSVAARAGVKAVVEWAAAQFAGQTV